MNDELYKLNMELRIFRQHVEALMDDEDRIRELRVSLYSAKSKRPSPIRAGKVSVRYPHDEVNEKIITISEIERNRDYHLYFVRGIMLQLQKLEPEEAEFLEDYYWDKRSIRGMADLHYMSKSGVFRERDRILEKMLEKRKT